MASLSYNNLRRKEVEIYVSATDRTQVKNLEQCKLNVIKKYKKNEKITTKIEPSCDEDVVNEKYLDTNLSNGEGKIASIEKDYFELKKSLDHSCKMIEITVKTTMQILMIKDYWIFMIMQITHWKNTFYRMNKW